MSFFPLGPSTNNGLESTNNVIKNENTFRQRLPLAKFLDVSINIVNRWSKERNPESESELDSEPVKSNLLIVRPKRKAARK